MAGRIGESGMKLCEDCKHHGRGADCWRGAKATNPISGKPEPNEANCYAQRESGWTYSMLFGWCGREGRFWEPK